MSSALVEHEDLCSFFTLPAVFGGVSSQWSGWCCRKLLVCSSVRIRSPSSCPPPTTTRYLLPPPGGLRYHPAAYTRGPPITDQPTETLSARKNATRLTRVHSPLQLASAEHGLGDAPIQHLTPVAPLSTVDLHLSLVQYVGERVWCKHQATWYTLNLTWHILTNTFFSNVTSMAELTCCNKHVITTWARVPPSCNPGLAWSGEVDASVRQTHWAHCIWSHQTQ